MYYDKNAKVVSFLTTHSYERKRWPLIMRSLDDTFSCSDCVPSNDKTIGE